MTSNHDAVSMSEDSILACIDRHFKNCGQRLLIGRGDDCAVLKNTHKNICVSTDMFIEDVHFRREYFTPFEIGHKALAVNISDLAAFGAMPLAFTLCLGMPENLFPDWLDSFFEGMASLADKYRLELAGGDLSKSDKIYISITIFGENQDNCSFLGRSGSRSGDIIFVVGDIGLARTGLALLEREGRGAYANFPAACVAHLLPLPQIEAGLILSRAGYNARPPALMDLSDGLARDLPRLLGWEDTSRKNRALGANLSLDPRMLHPELLAHSASYGLDPLQEALLGGEDYALLGSCAPDLFASLRTAIPNLWKIGEVTNSGKIICDDKDISDFSGFDHFAGGRQ